MTDFATLVTFNIDVFDKCSFKFISLQDPLLNHFFAIYLQTTANNYRDIMHRPESFREILLDKVCVAYLLNNAEVSGLGMKTQLRRLHYCFGCLSILCYLFCRLASERWKMLLQGCRALELVSTDQFLHSTNDLKRGHGTSVRT